VRPGPTSRQIPLVPDLSRRFQQWIRSDVMTKIMTALASKLSAKGATDVREAFIDASFALAKKGNITSERRNAAGEQRSWRLEIVTGCQFRFRSKARHHMK